MLVSDFEFELPDGRIATHPAEPRDAARLFVLDRATGQHRDASVAELPEFLQPGDLLVVNDTRVLPHRLLGRRAGGGRLETLILERKGGACRGYVKPAAKVRCGTPIAMEDGALQLIPEENLGGGLFRFRLEAESGDVDEALARVGRAPLPPYLLRDGAEDVERDRRDYQTLFATQLGAVAAPTAGLHFTPRLLAALAERSIELAQITLHVGEGTFAPVRVDRVEEHEMHTEKYVLPIATAEAVSATRARGGRVVAVGTTSARTLEACARGDGTVEPGEGSSDLFLYPGAKFSVVDALLTNFHLPCSTLLMLVSAFAGRDRVLEAYARAVDSGYRFYSFGDAMLVL